MFAVFDEILSAEPAVSISVKLVEPAKDDVKVLVREVLGHLNKANHGAGIPSSMAHQITHAHRIFYRIYLNRVVVLSKTTIDRDAAQHVEH